MIYKKRTPTTLQLLRKKTLGENFILFQAANIFFDAVNLDIFT